MIKTLTFLLLAITLTGCEENIVKGEYITKKNIGLIDTTEELELFDATFIRKVNDKTIKWVFKKDGTFENKVFSGTYTHTRQTNSDHAQINLNICYTSNNCKVSSAFLLKYPDGTVKIIQDRYGNETADAVALY